MKVSFIVLKNIIVIGSGTYNKTEAYHAQFYDVLKKLKFLITINYQK